MIRASLIAASASLALALGACGGEDTETAANDDLPSLNDMNMPAADEGNLAAAAPLPTADFVAAVAASDMYEIEAGKLAAEKGTRQEVKDFGTMLVADHNKSTAELKAAAAETPGTMPVPELTAEQQSMLESLRSASGAEFDAMFLDQQVQAHQKALDMLNAYAAGGEAEPLKQFATRTAPVIQAHLDRASALKQ